METDVLLSAVIQSTSTVSAWRNNFNSVERRNASELHRILHGAPLSNTPNCGCVDDFLRTLTNPEKITLKIKHMTSKKFQVKKGIVLQSFVLAEPLTFSSGDADCIKLLRSNPKNIKHFESFPTNWEEIVDAPVVDAPVVDAPVVDAPVVDAPVVDAPVVDAPVVDAPVVDAPVVDAPDEVLDFMKMKEPALRKYAKDNDISLQGKTGRLQIAELLIAKSNDI